MISKKFFIVIVCWKNCLSSFITVSLLTKPNPFEVIFFIAIITYAGCVFGLGL